MTAKEYLIRQLSDPYPEATSVQTQTALSAYAMRMHRGIEGYSLTEAEELLRECGMEDSLFIKLCTDFLSNSNAFLTYQSRIPALDD